MQALFFFLTKRALYYDHRILSDALSTLLTFATTLLVSFDCLAAARNNQEWKLQIFSSHICGFKRELLQMIAVVEDNQIPVMFCFGAVIVCVTFIIR